MGNVDKKASLYLAVPFAKDVLPNLVTKATSSVLHKFDRKISGEGAIATSRTWIALFISNEDRDDYY